MLGPAGLSSDSGLGGSTDGSTDILVFGSVVDSVTEEGMFLCARVLITFTFTDLHSSHFGGKQRSVNAGVATHSLLMKVVFCHTKWT